MKSNWIKRTLVGVAASAALLGGFAAYSQGNGWHHGPPTAEEMAAHQAKMVERIGKKLNLDANQTAKLQALAAQLQAQRAAMTAGGVDPHDQIASLMAGNTFNRAGAQQLVNQKIAQLQTGTPALITAAGDFFDSLNATQQQQVRDFMAKHHHMGPHGDHGPRGDHVPPAPTSN